MLKKIKEWAAWLLSKKVGRAIDRGCTYDEVLAIVRKEAEKW